MKAKRQPDGTYHAMLSATDAGIVHKVQEMLAGIRLTEHGSQTADVAHTTMLGLETILQDRGPAPAAPDEESDANH